MNAENKERTRATLLVTLAIFVKELVGFAGAIAGNMVDWPVLMRAFNVNEVAFDLSLLVRSVVAIIAVFLIWYIRPPSQWDKPLSNWIAGWLGDPHSNRWLYFLASLIGGVCIMAGMVGTASRESASGAIGMSLIVGVIAFFTTYFISLASRSDTATLQKERDQFKSEATGLSTAIKDNRKWLRDNLVKYVEEGEKKLAAMRNNEITLNETRNQFRAWREKVIAIVESSSYTVSSRGAAINPPSALPLDIEENSPEANVYKDFKGELLWLENVVKQLQ